jgi:hypothetical protein
MKFCQPLCPAVSNLSIATADAVQEALRNLNAFKIKSAVLFRETGKQR